MFNLKSDFKPTGDQPQAIEKLINNVRVGLKDQVLVGVTGSGKTFTMANVIQKMQMPALIISHNKTLAGQLYQEFRDFFPQNAVSYFVSYYDYYQPEAYIPQTDTYIEKEAQINELIEKLRLQSTTNILTRKDVIVVASVSCIYNIGSPVEYGRFILELSVGKEISFKEVGRRLAELQYERSEFEFKRGTFRIRGDRVDIYPAYEDYGYMIYMDKERIKRIEKFEPISGKKVKSPSFAKASEGKPKSRPKADVENLIIYPAKHYMTDPKVFNNVEQIIRNDLRTEATALKKQNKLVEAERLIRRVNFDLEMIKEVGYVNGIENYSRYFDGRKIGDPPYTLLDYFKKTYGENWLLFIDESHMTVPQLRGMYNGDNSRKKTLIDFGFRLKAAFDNRPLKFEEFYPQAKYIVYVSATPDEWEMNISKLKSQNSKPNLKSKILKTEYDGITEQLIRPTGIADPKIIIRPAKDEVLDLVKEIEIRAKRKEKVLVTTLTKRTAEDLTDYLKEKKIRASYLHSDIKTLERSDILESLRKGEFDALIGINLLREGLDLPEVSLVAILDADREGFLRSKTALIQTMGRAARNIHGKVIIYADKITGSIKYAVGEIERRRKVQLEYNKKNKITPKTIYKRIRKKIIIDDRIDETQRLTLRVTDIVGEGLTPYDRKKTIKLLEKEMKLQAENLNFELAIKIRDKVRELKN